MLEVQSAQLRSDVARTKVQKFLADLNACKAEQKSSLRRAEFSVGMIRNRGFPNMTIAYSEMQISDLLPRWKTVQKTQIRAEGNKSRGPAHRSLSLGRLLCRAVWIA